ncbi:MAG: hypothetical protein ACRDMJ_18040 [Solirubrobacteraceae bacterium]
MELEVVLDGAVTVVLSAVAPADGASCTPAAVLAPLLPQPAIAAASAAAATAVAIGLGMGMKWRRVAGAAQWRP